MTETQHPHDDALLDVALGHTDGEFYDQVVEHLRHCQTCRNTYDQLHDALEGVLPASPEIIAPPGFETKVLQRLHPPIHSQPETATPRTRIRKHHVALAAVAATLIGAIAGGVGVYIYEQQGTHQPEALAESSQDFAALVTNEGESVGWAANGYNTEGPVLVITLNEAPAGEKITCLGVAEDNSTDLLAEWNVYEDQANVWVLEDPEDPLKALELLNESGQVWAYAQW